MLKLTLTTVWIYSCRKIPHFVNIHTSVRNLCVKTKFNNRRYSRIIKGKKLLNCNNTTESLFRNGEYSIRHRSSRPAAAATKESSPIEGIPVFNHNKKDENITQKSSKESTKKSLPLLQTPLSPEIKSIKILNSLIDSSSLDVPPKPLKLLNAVDGTQLLRLYNIRPSLLSIYLGLAKSRLTSFVVITAMAGYTLSPSATMMNPDLIWIALGTFLTSASANTINQVVERNFDGLMDRTKNRALVKKLITPQHAMGFGVVSGSVGMMCLYSVNELAAIIGLSNLILYTCAYTPLKRKHIINTWVGSIVGALPPLIGYAGACNFLDARILVLSSIMFCWQFPHFNALSWNLRKEYDRAGYKMMCFVNERLCRHTTLRYSLLLTAICAGSPLLGVTNWSFAIDSGILNAYLCYLAWEFYKNPDAKTSRKLFRFTLVHLPVLIIFLILGKTTTVAATETIVESKEVEAVLPAVT